MYPFKKSCSTFSHSIHFLPSYHMCAKVYANVKLKDIWRYSTTIVALCKILFWWWCRAQPWCSTTLLSAVPFFSSILLSWRAQAHKKVFRRDSPFSSTKTDTSAYKYVHLYISGATTTIITTSHFNHSIKESSKKRKREKERQRKNEATSLSTLPSLMMLSLSLYLFWNLIIVLVSHTAQIYEHRHKDTSWNLQGIFTRIGNGEGRQIYTHRLLLSTF